MTALLSVSHLRSGYGKKEIVHEVTLAVGRGELVSLMGRNGMGKTTTLRTIMGLTQAWSGKVEFDGKNLTVYENMIMSARLGRWSLARVYELFPRLAERKWHWGNQLSGGEQQMLSI